MGYKSLSKLAIFVFYLTVVCSRQKSEKDSSYYVTVPEVFEVLRRNIIGYHMRDDIRSVPMRVKLVKCSEDSKPCQVEYEPMEKQEAILIVRQHILDNVSSLIDYEIIFWLLHAGGLRLGTFDSFRWNTYRMAQAEPLTLLKMLITDETRTSMGRIFDNATTLAAEYAFSQRFAELAHCFVSLGGQQTDLNHYEPDTIRKRFYALVFPYWLKVAIYQVKNEHNLSDIYEKQVIETEFEIEQELPPVRQAYRTDDFNVPIVILSFYTRRFLQLTVIEDQLKCEREEIEIKYRYYQNFNKALDSGGSEDEMLLLDSETLISGACASASPLKFRRVINEIFLSDDEETEEEISEQ